MAVNLIPLRDYVVIRRIEEKETVKGGIIIPDTAKEKQEQGEVIAVGPGRREKGELVPVDLKVGDRVIVGKYTGHDIKVEDVEYTLVEEKDIWAKIGGAAKAASSRK